MKNKKIIATGLTLTLGVATIGGYMYSSQSNNTPTEIENSLEAVLEPNETTTLDDAQTFNETISADELFDLVVEAETMEQASEQASEQADEQASEQAGEGVLAEEVLGEQEEVESLASVEVSGSVSTTNSGGSASSGSTGGSTASTGGSSSGSTGGSTSSSTSSSSTSTETASSNTSTSTETASSNTSTSSSTDADAELQALMEAHQAEFAAKYGTMTNEEVYAAQEALNNSSYGSHITMGQSTVSN